MKVKALEDWPPQEWKSAGTTLAPEDALDANDVSASVLVREPGSIALAVVHNDRTYSALLCVPEDLGQKVVLVISGASASKTLRQIGELEIYSQVPVS